MAIIAAVSLTLMMLLAALAVDLGFLRADRVASQSAADMAAAGAAVDYDQGTAGEARQACLDALALAVDNLYPNGSAPTVSAQAACETEFPDAFDAACEAGGVSGLARYLVGPYTLEITAPVANGGDLMGSQPAVADFDGAPCERIAVRVLRDRTNLFGGFSGVGQSTTSRWAVARSFLDEDGDDIASLVVLDLTGCRTLRTTSSSANVRVFDSVLDGETISGDITVDTRPTTCTGNQKIVEPASSSRITTGGRFFANALATTDVPNEFTFNSSLSAFSATNPTGQLTHPEPGARQTRRVVDHRVNCRKGGYFTDDRASVPYRGVSLSPAERAELVPPCPASGADTAYVEALRAAYQPLTATSAASQGFQVITGGACNDATTYTATTPGVSRVYIDCAGYPANRNVTFNGYAAIVAKDHLRVDGSLTVTGPATTGTVLYVQRQGLEIRGNARLRHTFTYIEAPNAAGGGSDQERLYTAGSTGIVALQAPLDRTACAGTTPNAACFAPLALWSNGLPEHGFVSNNANGGIIGSVFVPNAPFKLRSSGTTSEAPCVLPVNFNAVWASMSTTGVNGLDLEAAQFFARAIDVAGNATIRMCPNPTTNIPTPRSGSGLIR